jgi:hypothetical protein
MHDFLKILLFLVQSFHRTDIGYPDIDSRDPALEFQLMIKDYGIDLKPKPFDPELEKPKPKDRVIASSKAPQKKYTLKSHTTSGAKPLVEEDSIVDLNGLGQTLGGFFNRTN